METVTFPWSRVWWWLAVGTAVVTTVAVLHAGGAHPDESIAATGSPSAAIELYPDLPALRHAIDLLYRTHYQKARSELDAIARTHSRHPAGPFFGSLVDFAMLYEGADVDPALERRFLEALEATLERAERLREGEASKAIGYFYEGSAHGFWARHHGLQGHWWGAYRHGIKARDALEHALELDPSLVDANLGLGVYHVYADVLPGFIKMFDWLLRIRGDRTRGLRELETARREGILTRTEATFYLCTIATEFERRYETGLMRARELLRSYPRNPAFRALEGRALMGLGEYEHAERRLRALYLDDLWHRPRHVMRQSAYELGRILVRRGAEHQGRALLLHHFATADDPFTWFLPWATYYIGVANDVLGDRDEARGWYEKTAAMQDRLGSEDRANKRRKASFDEAERRWEHARALARTRAGAAEAVIIARQLATGGDEEGGLEEDERRRAWWIAGVAALRAGDARSARASFDAAITAGVESSVRAYCLLGSAYASLVLGDAGAARAAYEAIRSDAELAGLHGVAWERLRRLQTHEASVPRAPEVSDPPAGSERRLMVIDSTALEAIMSPELVVDVMRPSGVFGRSYTLQGRFGRFEGYVMVPPEGLAYRLRVPGLAGRLDPANPRVRVRGGRVDSFLPGAGGAPAAALVPRPRG